MLNMLLVTALRQVMKLGTHRNTTLLERKQVKKLVTAHPPSQSRRCFIFITKTQNHSYIHVYTLIAQMAENEDDQLQIPQTAALEVTGPPELETTPSLPSVDSEEDSVSEIIVLGPWFSFFGAPRLTALADRRRFRAGWQYQVGAPHVISVSGC